MPADIIILAAIAAFVLLRLRGVLGQKIGHDKPPAADASRKEGDRVIQLKMVNAPAQNAMLEEPSPAVAEEPLGTYTEAVEHGIEKIRVLDADFRMKDFMDGATLAFEMVHEAFRKDDRETLKMLLSKEIYAQFSAELDTRKTAEKREESTLISIVSKTPTEASVEKNKARVTVAFVSEQVSVVRDVAGTVVEGSPSDVQHVEDVWSFERDLRSANPNWTIVAT